MKVSADDDIYRARLVYLGPERFTFPIQLPYAQWGVGAVVFAVLAIVLWPLLGWFGISCALGAALPLTAWVFRHVDPDRPARKILGTVAKDWRQTAPAKPGPTTRYTAKNVEVTP